MDNIKSKVEQFKERRLGHTDIWECTLEEFIKKVLLECNKQQKENNITYKIMELSAQFLRIKFDNKELKGTIEYEVAKAIEESMMYYVNVCGEDL